MVEAEASSCQLCIYYVLTNWKYFKNLSIHFNTRYILLSCQQLGFDKKVPKCSTMTSFYNVAGVDVNRLHSLSVTDKEGPIGSILDLNCCKGA